MAKVSSCAARWTMVKPTWNDSIVFGVDELRPFGLLLNSLVLIVLLAALDKALHHLYSLIVAHLRLAFSAKP